MNKRARRLLAAIFLTTSICSGQAPEEDANRDANARGGDRVSHGVEFRDQWVLRQSNAITVVSKFENVTDKGVSAFQGTLSVIDDFGDVKSSARWEYTSEIPHYEGGERRQRPVIPPGDSIFITVMQIDHEVMRYSSWGNPILDRAKGDLQTLAAFQVDRDRLRFKLDKAMLVAAVPPRKAPPAPAPSPSAEEAAPQATMPARAAEPQQQDAPTVAPQVTLPAVPAAAEFARGVAFTNGDGVDKDLTEAAKAFQRAADLGHAPAQHKLGVAYAMGWGVPKSDETAVTWYRKAADLGFAEAQHDLAVRCIIGKGTPKNVPEGIAWYRKAAAQGWQESIAALKHRGLTP